MRALIVAIVLALAPAPLAMAGVDWSHARGLHARHAVHARASYYASSLDGRRTASGERYDANALTAAHRTLPLGTLVRVVDDATRRAVVVRINDRGPFARGRSIDLSRRAAQALGLLHAGVADVTLEVVSLPDASAWRALELAAGAA